MDFVGPTVADDIRRAIWRYGPEAVKAAVKEATKEPRGRTPEPDWPELVEEFKADARRWLEREDRFVGRSNYAIARDFAERKPGHDQGSTRRRIERKLKKEPYGRRWWAFLFAEQISKTEQPYEAYLRTLERLTQLSEEGASSSEGWRLDRARALINEYKSQFGELPQPDRTFAAIQREMQPDPLDFAAKPHPGGTLASLSIKYEITSGPDGQRAR